MKQFWLWFLTCALLASVTGCRNMIGNRVEINRLDFIGVLGVDKSIDSPDGVRLTIVSKSPGSGKPDSASGGLAVKMSTEGRTVQEAIRNFSLDSSKVPYFGHLDFILLGEEIAKENAVQYIDFLVRDHELRLNTRVLLARNTTAEKAIDMGCAGKKYIGDTLDNFSKNLEWTFDSGEVELVELMRTFDNPLLSAHLPCITLASKTKTEKTGLQSDGMAIFKGFRLIGYMDDTITRGMNWPKNKVSSGLLVVKDHHDKNIVLEIHDNTGKMIPDFKKGKLTVTFDIKVSSNISEVMGNEDIFHTKTLDFLEKQQKAAIRKEIEMAINYAQQKNVDIFGISSATKRKFPVKWKQGKFEGNDNWEKTFRKLKIKIKIDSNINRTYNLRQSTGYRKG